MTGQGHVAQARADERERLVVAGAGSDEVRMLLIQPLELRLEGGQLEEVVVLLLAGQLDVVNRTAVALVDLVVRLEVRAPRAVPAFVGSLVDIAVVPHPGEDLFDHLFVLGVGGADEEVVARPELGGERLEALRVAVSELLGRDAEGVGGIGDGLAVLVGAREVEHPLLALAVVAGHHVGGDRRVGVPEVGGRVDVVDRRRHIEGHAGPRLLSRTGELAIELVGAQPGQLRHRRGRGARPRARLDQLAEPGEPLLQRGLAGRRRHRTRSLSRHGAGARESASRAPTRSHSGPLREAW